MRGGDNFVVARRMEGSWRLGGGCYREVSCDDPIIVQARRNAAAATLSFGPFHHLRAVAGRLLADGAQALVTANAITNTRTWGIAVTGAESSGTISRNEIRAAGLAGIGVSHAANATVLQNDLPASDTHGILVEGDQLEVVRAGVDAGSGDHRPQLLLAAQGAHGGPHAIALLQQGDDAVGADEAGPSGHEDELTCHARSVVRLRSRSTVQ